MQQEIENFGELIPSRNQIMSLKVGKTSVSQFGTISDRDGDNNNYEMENETKKNS